MMPSILIFENFYTNVDEVRKHALTLDFDREGNFPGFRSPPEPQAQSDYLKQYFEEELLRTKITSWDSPDNTCYQITTTDAQSWVHADSTDWAGVLYLTPDAPIESGTATYRPIVDNAVAARTEDFEQIDSFANMYNRLVLYRGEYLHRSILPGFGTDKYTGRLFQTFFFNT
jgi:hypothetical protein